MKKIYLLIAFISLATFSKSQTLNTNHFPSPGDVYNYFYADTLGILPGAAGAAQEWNFEDLNVDTILQTDTYTGPVVVNPPIADQTVTLGDSLQGFNFYKNTAADYTMLGFSDSANVNVVAYSNAMTLLTFPFSFGNTSSDNFAFTTTYQGNNVNVTGTINTSADGSGNLLLPQGAFNNLIRLKYTIVANITVLVFNIVQTQNIYEWYDGINKFPLLHIETINTTDPFGGAPTNDKIVYLAATGPAGIKTTQNKIDFNLAPNPAQENVNIKFNNEVIGQTKIVITNTLGQLVFENNNVDSKLSNLNINTSNLNKGVYFVSVIQNNKTITKKLVVQ